MDNSKSEEKESSKKDEAIRNAATVGFTTLIGGSIGGPVGALAGAIGAALIISVPKETVKEKEKTAELE